MTEKKTRLEPSRKASGDPKRWARRAREFSERLAAQAAPFQTPLISPGPTATPEFEPTESVCPNVGPGHQRCG